MKGIAALLYLASVALSAGHQLTCYFGSWAVYRQGSCKFDVETIDPHICTHLIYGFAGLGSDNKIRPLDSWNDLCDNYGKCAYNRFVALKKKNPKLVTTLSVGGWNEGSAKYSRMAASAAGRQTFATSAVALLKKHGFDGLDMDWEYPTKRGGHPEDGKNFVLLLQELQKALKAEGMTLTVAVSAGDGTIQDAYPDMVAVANAVDYIHVMAFDFHGSWEKFTHHQSILYPYPGDSGATKNFNTDWAITHWLSTGVPANKVVMGAPLYGRCYRLNSMDDHGMLAPANSPAMAGPCTKTAGTLGYNEICEIGKTRPWTVVREKDLHGLPYAYSKAYNDAWCSYDDAYSMNIKAQYANERGLAGIFTWSIETDDFHGECGPAFTLLSALRNGLAGGNYTTPVPPTTTPFTGTTVTTHSTTPGTTTTTTMGPTPAPSKYCKKPGYNPDPDDCTVFFDCMADGKSYKPYKLKCPPGELFDPRGLLCNYKQIICSINPPVCQNDCKK